MARTPYRSQWQALRARWALLLPMPCARCGEPVAPDEPWHLDHLVPVAMGGGPETARPAHARCNMTAGSRLRAQLRAEGEEQAARRFFGDVHATADVPVSSFSPQSSESSGIVTNVAEQAAASPNATDPVWSSCPWLADLLDVPPDAAWPRYMTAPHPRAVGSYGAEFAAWSERRSGRPLRWWQRLAATRLLEHDAAGLLVWLTVLLTTSRQVGKSVLLGDLALWRIEQAERWGEPQLALLVSKDNAAAAEVHRPARAWARGQGWKVREANGEQEIAAPDGSRWAIRGQGSVYSYSASLAMVDEAWAVDPAAVEDGLEPTMAERTSPQLLLTSTAHRRPTPLFPKRRRMALEQLDAPDETLLLEWSAPGGADPAAVATWRAASPSWSPRRERLIATNHTTASTDEPVPGPDHPLAGFAAQWLNQWPLAVAPRHRGRDEPLLEPGAWDALTDYSVSADAEGPTVVAVEDHYGRGAALAVAQRTDAGTVIAWGRLHDSRADALAAAAELTTAVPDTRLVIGASLDGDPGIPKAASVTLANTTTTRTALPLLRDLVARHQLAHDGDPQLSSQVDGLRVVPSTSGGLTVSTTSPRSDLARSVAWAVAALVGDSVPAFFVF